MWLSGKDTIGKRACALDLAEIYLENYGGSLKW